MSEFSLTKAQEKALDVLASDATYSALYGGSRSGKTALYIWAVVNRALMAPGSRHAIFRFTFSSCKQSIALETMPKIMGLAFPELPSANSMLDRSDWFYTFPNGSEIWISGMDSDERMDKVLGKEYVTIYFNECSQIPYDSIETARSRLAQKVRLNDAAIQARLAQGIQGEYLALKCYHDFNPPSKRHWSYMQFIQKLNPVDKQPLVDPGDFTHYRLNPMDNLENISDNYIKTLETMSEKKRARFLHGQFSDSDDGALWTVELLAQNRRLATVEKPLPEFQRIIIAVDPSGCSGPEDERSDEIGIVVMALGTDGHGYVLEDLSGKFGPNEWSTVVGEAYNRHSADRIVAERNFGGAMVESTIKAYNPNLPVDIVNASRGKVVRADPISELYAQNKIHHVGHFPELEDQLTSFMQSGYIGLRSPDRADALVWAATALFPMMTKKVDKKAHAYKVKSNTRSASRFGVRV